MGPFLMRGSIKVNVSHSNFIAACLKNMNLPSFSSILKKANFGQTWVLKVGGGEGMVTKKQVLGSYDIDHNGLYCKTFYCRNCCGIEIS